MAEEKRHLLSAETQTEKDRKWPNPNSILSIKAVVDPCPSEVDLLQLHLNIFLCKNGVLENLHYFLSGPLKVVRHFSLRDRLGTLGLR